MYRSVSSAWKIMRRLNRFGLSLVGIFAPAFSESTSALGNAEWITAPVLAAKYLPVVSHASINSLRKKFLAWTVSSFLMANLACFISLFICCAGVDRLTKVVVRRPRRGAV